jgi:Mg2+/Co2+ transporter CorC
MAGLVLERVGRIPGTGESFEIQGLEVTVRNAEPHRLVTLEVTIPDRRPADEKGPS